MTTQEKINKLNERSQAQALAERKEIQKEMKQLESESYEAELERNINNRELLNDVIGKLLF